MGSEFTIISKDSPNIEEILSHVLDRVEWLEQQLSHFEIDSDISIINRNAFKQPVPVSPVLFKILMKIRSWSELTESAFAPTMGKLIREWGFFQRGSGSEAQIFPPTPDKMKTLTEKCGWKYVILDEKNSAIQFKTPDVELHLGAVGKGIAVQMAADFLQENGMRCALISSGGSSFYALGSPPDSEGWKIGITHPINSDLVFGTVTISDRALSISSSVGQTRYDGEQLYGHILDPRTGESLTSQDCVVVAAEDAAYAEALSTAFLVQGENWTRDFIGKYPQVGCVFYHTDQSRAVVFNFQEFESVE